MPPNDFIKSLNEDEAAKKKQQSKDAQLHAINKAGIKNVEATNANTKSTATALKHVKGSVKVTNPDLAKTEDVASVVDAVHKLNMTTFMANKGLPQLSQNLSDLSDKTSVLQEKLESEGLKKVSDQLGVLVTKLDIVSKVLSKSEVSVDAKLQETIDNLSKSINAIDFKPSVNVTAPNTKVVSTPIDLSKVVAGLASVEQAIRDTQPTDDNEDKLDLLPVISGLSSVQNAITSLRFPVPNYILPFKDVNGKDTQVSLNASGNVPVDVIVGGSTQYTQGGATVANPTGTAEIWFDGSGNPKAITPTQPLPSNITDGTNIASVVTETNTFGDVKNGFLMYGRTSGSGASSIVHSLRTDANGALVTDSDGTNAGNIVANDTGYNGRVINNATKIVPFTTSVTGAQTLLANTDVRGYAWMQLVLSAAGSGLTWTAQSSSVSGGTYINYGNTWSVSSQVTNALAVVGITTNVTYETQTYGAFFQLAISAMTGGTTTGYIVLSAFPRQYHTNGVALSSTQQIGANSATGSAFPANAFGQGVKALTASPAAATTGNLVAVSGNVVGEQLVTTGGLVTSSVPANASNVVVKAAPGRLGRILVTTTGANPLLVYDSSTTNSGTIIGALPANPAVGTIYDFSMPAAAGITIAGSATNPAVTVSWT